MKPQERQDFANYVQASCFVLRALAFLLANEAISLAMEQCQANRYLPHLVYLNRSVTIENLIKNYN